MREGLYEVELIDNDGRPFLETAVDGKTYAHAVPGSEFSVRITVHRNPQTNRFPFDYLRLGLFIDGHDVNYWKRMDLTASGGQKMVSAAFQGWKKNTVDLRAFQFALPALATPQDAADPTLNAEMSKKPLGQIKIVVHEATLSTGTFENKSGFHEMPGAQKVSEDKKFWQQASVTTTAGRHIESEKEKFTPLPVWKNISATPNYELMLNYHTVEMVHFIKTFSEHQKKVQAAAAASAAAGAAAGASSGGGGGAKRKRKEPAPEPIVVDLTLDDDESPAGIDRGNIHSGSAGAAPATKTTGDKDNDNDNDDEAIFDTDEEEEEGDGDGEVQLLDKRTLHRDVDMLDMTGGDGEEEATWQKVTRSRE